MRLPNGVLSAVRGIGGAAVIAAAVAGCGASSASSPSMAEKPAEITPIVAQPEEPYVPDEIVVSQPEDYDMAVACGRG